MKVLIADDENLICEWLQFCISQNNKCQLVGVAHNGKQALELYYKEEPDLILTDVKMPVMDGLQLLKEIRKNDEKTKIVMLTAFAEFNIVREALRIGANEYFLKTEMQNEELQILLSKMAKEFGNNNYDSFAMVSSQTQSVISQILKKKNYLTENDLNLLRSYGVKWRNNGLFALAVWKHTLMQNSIRFPESDIARHVAAFDLTNKIYVVVGNLPRTLSEHEKIRMLNNYAKETQKLNDCMLGVSAITDEMVNIPVIIQQAQFALTQSFFAKENRLYEQLMPQNLLISKNLECKQKATEFKIELLQYSNKEKLFHIENFLQDINKQRVLTIESTIKICADIYEIFYLDNKNQNIDLMLPEIFINNLNDIKYMDDLISFFMKTISVVSSHNDIKNIQSKAIQLSLLYISDNFAKPLSLEEVADNVYLNAEYFSRLFKEEVGVSFVSYLTDLRISHALELLKTTAMRVQDIANEVGYPNVSYFSTTFKKKIGMSPYEYRRKN